jgi:hypothetical protein
MRGEDGGAFALSFLAVGGGALKCRELESYLRRLMGRRSCHQGLAVQIGEPLALTIRRSPLGSLVLLALASHDPLILVIGIGFAIGLNNSAPTLDPLASVALRP